eukprot:TRINITY_DN12020_c0_g1_i1.p1 TRINITY_DN12020_c0_g1~~TRINITY_DN12020_c0_g1_i1.p1  ORF type:complete len:107 (+),score=16.24 TRINITY_DN12020_c0_g1_i1:292-612(+)
MTTKYSFEENELMIFLFDDKLVVSTTAQTFGSLLILSVYPVETLLVWDCPDRPGTEFKNIFEIINTEDPTSKLKLSAVSQDIKDIWIDTINQTILNSLTFEQLFHK